MATTRVKLKAPAVGLAPRMILLALLFLLVSPTHAFFRHLCHGTLGNGRVDPIMAPGSPSQHLHVMFGASNMGLDPTLDDLLASNCTSCSILQDHSVYWSPLMYFQHANGTFEMVPTEGGLTVYYFTEPSPVDTTPVVAFPQNFRMIAGNSLKRAFYGPVPDPPSSLWNGSDTTQQALMEKALGFNCLNYNLPPEGAREYHYLRNKTFLDATCADGIRAEVMFPSCWNGVDLDSANHTTHVAYPDQIQNGICPEGYPVKIPTLFYETIYQTNLFNGTDGEFTFANGDPTGYGYHGDFLCAWEEGVLQSAINDPVCNLPIGAAGNQEDCPIFKVQNPDVGTQCQMEVPEVLQSEQINFVQQLPGNVQVQAGPAPATIGPIPGAPAPTSTSSPSVANTIMSAPGGQTPGSTAIMSMSSPAVTPLATPSTSNSQFTTTTSYMSNGVMVNLILIEEFVTVTLTDGASPTNNKHKRHAHNHGRRNGRDRL
ncbi:uncharacterized protein Z520_05071 [Fonsecaea multimorphosa CBS 102226]|uniref:DUF1996 domain-containing protein n=1 Tax=Fonsecaea multimorphosa CBS 102226 TaxID=1442371 RepID=A0A0D2HC80_9EURO|nr:uncharacterized protein Z520_05071 [Fonsecaea multimorphosa CBS 102226]KIX99495.1 hypothetical protein Z520_05071 [Fonsecaea multimorphosa CBS 102226]OAL25488.1 hypothetical protein AYO22_04807 [Fonsecaea multimorphosa]